MPLRELNVRGIDRAIASRHCFLSVGGTNGANRASSHQVRLIEFLHDRKPGRESGKKRTKRRTGKERKRWNTEEQREGGRRLMNFLTSNIANKSSLSAVSILLSSAKIHAGSPLPRIRVPTIIGSSRNRYREESILEIDETRFRTVLPRESTAFLAVPLSGETNRWFLTRRVPHRFQV